jgi:soluble lytic murein transglycosylase-like protein
MRPLTGPLLACALPLVNTPANAQAGATPPSPEARESAGRFTTASEPNGAATQAPTADDVCRAVEQSAAENALPVEFFARVIWQESRFNAKAVSPKGAEGIAQFMPRTASWHGLADPFDPIEALRHSAAYLRELLGQFGNLGLAAAAYNAGGVDCLFVVSGLHAGQFGSFEAPDLASVKVTLAAAGDMPKAVIRRLVW